MELIQQSSPIDPAASPPRATADSVSSTFVSARAELVPTALCLLVALVPLVFAVQLIEPYVAPKEILVQTGTATIAFLWLLTARSDSWSLPRTPVWIPLLTLAFIGAISLWWSTNPVISFEKGRYLVTYLLLFTIALWAMQRAEVRSSLAAALVLAGAIEAVYVLLQYLVGDPVFAVAQLPGKWQTFGTLGNPNWTGEFLAVAALVSLGRLIELRKTTANYATHSTLVALILMLFALVATLARGAWVAFIIGFAAFAVTRGFSDLRVRIKSLVLPLAAIVLAVAVVIVSPLLSNDAAVGHLLNLKSIRGRLLMWESTLLMIRDAPLTGHGLGTFGLHFPAYQAQILADPSAAYLIPNASFTTFAHNDYLQLWAETGLFGLLAFGALIWIVLRRGRTLAEDPIALGFWAGVISILTNAAVAFPFHLPTTLMLFVVLVAAVEAAVTKKSVRLPKKGRNTTGRGCVLDIPKQIAVAFVTILLCLSAVWLSYDRVVADATLWRANAALANKQFDDAEPDIRTAIKHNPTEQAGHIMLGRLLVERGQYTDALTVLNEAHKLGFDAEIFGLKANLYAASGQHNAAVESMNELIRLRPDLQWPRDRVAALSLNADGNKENIR